MKILDYFKDKIISIFIILFIVFTIEILLIGYNLGIVIKVYIGFSIIIAYVTGIVIEFYNKRKYYEDLKSKLNELNEKYLIAEVIKEPNFIEGKILKEVLEQTDKSMIENVNKYKYLQEEYKEYIELWIHEIKLPIAVSKMIIENNKNEITKSINEELEKIDNYTQQALFYARSSTVSQDYYIKKNKLRDIVNDVIYKNKDLLIRNKITIDSHDLDNIVNTDSKWVIFILNQIIQNSVKYKKKDELSKIEICSDVRKENVILCIKDNGIGIKKDETKKVFDKGFTGTNGRVLNKKSTGIGLYLCKKLCDKLGIGIELNSIYNKGTNVSLIFPNNSYIDIK